MHVPVGTQVTLVYLMILILLVIMITLIIRITLITLISKSTGSLNKKKIKTLQKGKRTG